MATFNQNSTWLGYIDLSKNELRNARIQNLASAPGSPVEGQLYYDTVAHALYWWNNTAWTLATGGTVNYGSPAALTVGNAASDGVASTISRSDHVHLMPGFAAVTAQTTYGAASGNGSASTLARSDHTHGTPALSANVASTQAIGDTATNGTGTAPAKDDHKHAMPAFGAVTAQTTFGSASGNGAAATIARSDHTHGTPTHDTAAHSAVSISGLANPTADRAWGGFKITGLADPTAAQDAATKAYVDSVSIGLDVKASVRVATTAAGTLSSSFANGQTVDGVTLATGNRILIKNQAAGAENGIYTVNASGAPTRATDADTAGEISGGMFTFVEEGTANADTGWVCTNNGVVTIGTTALTFSQFSGAGSWTAGSGLTQSGTTMNVGAGTGITVNADDVAINTSVVARKYIAGTGPGSTGTTWVITHNLANRDVAFHVYDATTYAEVYCDAVRTDANTLTLTFAAIVTLNTLRAVVIG